MAYKDIRDLYHKMACLCGLSQALKPVLRAQPQDVAIKTSSLILCVSVTWGINKKHGISRLE